MGGARQRVGPSANASEASSHSEARRASERSSERVSIARAVGAVARAGAGGGWVRPGRSREGPRFGHFIRQNGPPRNNQAPARGATGAEN